MHILTILKWVSAIATILTGLFALIRPASAQGFIGLRAEGGRGITEIRSVFGGLFIAFGVAVLYYNKPAVFKTLGLSYAGIAAARAVSMVVERSYEQSNVISLVTEVIMAVILLF